MRLFVSSLGEDSHEFEEEAHKPLRLGGVLIPDSLELRGNSDADVILHAICRGLTGLSGCPILGAPADQLCQNGITDSSAYLALGLEELKRQERQWKIHLISIALEGKRPRLDPYRTQITERIAQLMGIKKDQVTMTISTGENLTLFGEGKGLSCRVIISASYEDEEEARPSKSI